ncbi:hypothetical protein Bbelb_055020 [Branchiostoma belcheri]|nr:hypothetical protein Bbelb_055020 [Branchiostoma belcheri]
MGTREEFESDLNSTRAPLTKDAVTSSRRDLIVRTPRGTPPVAGIPPGHISYVTDQMNRIKPMPARLLSPTGASRGYIPDGHRPDARPTPEPDRVRPGLYPRRALAQLGPKLKPRKRHFTRVSLNSCENDLLPKPGGGYVLTGFLVRSMTVRVTSGDVFLKSGDERSGVYVCGDIGLINSKVTARRLVVLSSPGPALGYT